MGRRSCICRRGGPIVLGLERLVGRLRLTNCIKIAISGSAQSSCQTLCCCYQRAGEGRYCRRRYTLHFCWFLEVHSCCCCSCCCRSGWACSIEPKLTAILPVCLVAWSRVRQDRRHKRHDDFNALSCSLCHCLSAPSACPGLFPAGSHAHKYKSSSASASAPARAWT